MFGERTEGALLVLSECVDSAREAEFGAWYDHHLARFVATGLFHRASRYDSAASGASARYLALYETDEPLARVAAELEPAIDRMREVGEITPLIEVKHRVLLRTMEPGRYSFADADPGALTGLLFMANNPKTPGTDDAFNRWYDDVHRIDIRDTGLYVTMNRFKAAEEGEVRYVNLYETALENVELALTGLDEFRPKWQAAGTLYADRVNTLRGAYRLRARTP